ncbi:hypothetical protein ZHAS_00015812 [Anopheles sinensis]|uniref:Uncharacterized protein n=1 Tax=Anopheles sinensis TaxID=74873 RepID=A0A084WC00_ANOSI|nr:hypothetical protein ZHAS_00015812 [Anopheles sinensis]
MCFGEMYSARNSLGTEPVRCENGRVRAVAALLVHCVPFNPLAVRRVKGSLMDRSSSV